MALTYLTHYERYRKSVDAGASDPLASDAPIFKQFDVEVDAFSDRRVRFTITTSTPDRENDVVVTDGIDTSNYERNGVVMWAHDYKQLPVGRCIALERSPNKMIATVEFATADLNPFAEQVYRMVKAGFIKACSIGFRPTGWDYNDARGGVDFQKSEMLEFSICPIPANAEALIAASKAGIDVAVLKDWARRILADDADPIPSTRQAVIDVEKFLGIDLGAPADPIRWNKSLSKSFDVTATQCPARSVEQDLAAKHCGVAIKDLHQRNEPVASTRMGAFLYALDETLLGMKVDDLRNIGQDGKEEPPLYEHIQLNSKTSGEYVVDGLRFLQWNGVKLALRVEPRWYGLQVTTYVARKHASAAAAVFGKTFARAKELNFLKGEAFSLSGEFLTRGTESFDDVFLSDENQKLGKRLVKLLGEHGASIENRGVIMLGPPGNGKTLLGRILMNTTKSTFVWCSARDFHYGGGFNGLAEAFEIGRESAAAGVPAILFIEDVDNYLDGYTTDLMKTEMDGISQSKGVVTILTTNYPESLPKALIDRPGRFHDVLRFDLPNEGARLSMLRKWLPELTGADLQDTVKALHGYSGAHVREFARFAGIIRSQDGVSIGDAAKSAIAKLKEQRDLIASVQSSGSRYRAPQAIVTAALELANQRKETHMPVTKVLVVGRETPSAALVAALVSKASPKDVSTVKAPEDQSWSAPTLGDFSTKQWGDLTSAEKTHIAGHYAYAKELPPDAFGDLALPHHDASNGHVVWKGVVGAIARLNQTSIPSGDMGPVKAHLKRHYVAFRPDADLPDALKAVPWERDAVAWKAYEKAAARLARKAELVTDAALADLLEGYGFDAEAAVLRDVSTSTTGEEEAELVGYQTLASLLGQAASSVDEALDLAKALISAEIDEPTETPEDEDAEEAIEEARLDAIIAQATQAASTLAAVVALVCEMKKDDDDDADGYGDVTSYPTMTLDEIVAKIAGDAPLTPEILRQAIELCAKAGLDVVDKRFLKQLRKKAGRVLSKKNQEMLTKAVEHSTAATAHVQGVLDAVTPPKPPDNEDEDMDDDDDETESAKTLRADDRILTFIDDGADDDVLVLAIDDVETRAIDDAAVTVDLEDVLAGVRDFVVETISTETRAAIDSLRGRVTYDR